MDISKAEGWEYCDQCDGKAIIYLESRDAIYLCADCLAEVCKVAGWEVIDEQACADSSAPEGK